ncbi:MAG TPA: hypothetical protein VNN80_33510, partial [Polyangiaceae bacterium]|nr:hypothetical protein [Polyangiaceae bacterium]
EERRLHLLAGYGSMFAYCTARLGMSEDEACRRIDVARLARRFPLLLEKLAGGHVSLSVAALLKPHLTSANHGDLLAAVAGKTVQQAREVLAAWFPRPDVATSIRKLPTRPTSDPSSARDAPDRDACQAPTTAAATPLRIQHDLPIEVASAPRAIPEQAAPPSRTDASPRATAPSPSPASDVRSAALGSSPPMRAHVPTRNIEPLSAARFRVQFTADAELKRKLELARDLSRHALPHGDLADIVARALDLLIEHLMKRRFAVRSERKRDARAPAPPPPTSSEPIPRDPAVPPTPEAPNAETGPTNTDARPAPTNDATRAALDEAAPHDSTAHDTARAPGEQMGPTNTDATAAPTSAAAAAPDDDAPLASPHRRHVPSDVRRAVLARDGARCTYRGPDGVRCDSRAWLELDHITPFGCGGDHHPANIRLFCRAHNRLAAEQAYGQDTISRCIASRRARRPARSATDPRSSRTPAANHAPHAEGPDAERCGVRGKGRGSGSGSARGVGVGACSRSALDSR